MNGAKSAVINTILSAIIVAMLYLILHAVASLIDREHCLAHGMAYDGTTLAMEGWCVQGTIRIRADMVGGGKS